MTKADNPADNKDNKSETVSLSRTDMIAQFVVALAKEIHDFDKDVLNLTREADLVRQFADVAWRNLYGESSQYTKENFKVEMLDTLEDRLDQITRVASDETCVSQIRHKAFLETVDFWYKNSKKEDVGT